MKMPTDAELYLSDARGIFIPRDFATSIKRECVANVTAGDWEVLAAGPDHEWYWVTWSDVERTAVITNPVTGRYCFQRVEAYAEAADDPDDCADAAEQAIVDALQSFAHWIGCTIAAEWEYQFSDECVDESIEANGYEFTADGEVY